MDLREFLRFEKLHQIVDNPFLKQLTNNSRVVKMGNSSILSSSSNHSLKKQPFVVGIDLGTTNSLMAIASMDLADKSIETQKESDSDDSPFLHFLPVRLLQLPQKNLDGTTVSHYLFPSIVFQETPDSEPIVGLGAKEAKYKYRRGKNVFYSVKMDLGLDYDPFYPSAVSPQLNTPLKVSALILKKMKESAEQILGRSLDKVPVVITVPASFQSPQRRDTLNAAKMAGFIVDEQSLFDEPNAALLGYINRQRAQLKWHTEEIVLVFDFGGGTCDISIVDVSFAASNKSMHLKNLALSRFEKLGGDDIDKHLVHEWLKHVFYKVTGKEERQWSYAERQHSIWSQLAKIAELLKIRFCEELENVLQGKWDEEKAKGIVVSIPTQVVETSLGPIELSNLSLDWPTFYQVIRPFIDPTCSGNSNKEFYYVTSIFTPIKDALQKANLKPEEITRVLLAGGSSKNPLIEESIKNFLPNAVVERQKNMDYLVAEGAAVHAYFRFIYGHNILAPIVGDSIGIIVEGNQFQTLIPAGATIPFPNQHEWKIYEHFTVPREGMDHVDLIICAGNVNRPIHVVKLSFGRTVEKNTEIIIRVRLDGNKIFSIAAYLPKYPQIKVEESIENPLGLLPMSHKERRRAELEKELAKAQYNGILDERIEEMEELVDVLNGINLPEQALKWIEQIEKRSHHLSRNMLFEKAFAYDTLGEREKSHQVFVEIFQKNPHDAYAALNASLTAADHQTKEYYIRKAVEAAPQDGVCWKLYADYYMEAGNFTESRKGYEKSRLYLEKAVQSFPANTYYLSHLADVLIKLGEQIEAFKIQAKITQIKSSRTGDVNTDHVPGVLLLSH